MGELVKFEGEDGLFMWVETTRPHNDSRLDLVETAGGGAATAVMRRTSRTELTEALWHFHAPDTSAAARELVLQYRRARLG